VILLVILLNLYEYRYSATLGNSDYYSNSNICHTITELNGNVYFEEGYYNFTLNSTNCLAGDIFLGFDNVMINVANLYGSITKTTDMPIYLCGYYKIYSRILSYYGSDIDNLNVKYYKRLLYNYDHYTILSRNINYIINTSYVYNDIELERLFIYKNITYSDNVPIINHKFYVDMNGGVISSALIQDFRMYNNSDNFTSNIINGFDINGYYYNVKYKKFEEVVDVNRWQRTENYYLHNNGVLNRGIYYNEGNIGIGTSSCQASLDINTASNMLYSIRTNNPIWVNNRIITSSDERIKTNIKDIDDGNALEKLMLIQPKIYEYIDKNRTNTNVFGFIAQQVGDVIPEAVKKEKEFIPNIYNIGLCADNMILFDNSVDLYNNVVVGDVIQMIFESGEKTSCIIESIVNKYTMIINKVFTCDKIFVYGQRGS